MLRRRLTANKMLARKGHSSCGEHQLCNAVEKTPAHDIAGNTHTRDAAEDTYVFD